jgi:hypothetical protein
MYFIEDRISIRLWLQRSEASKSSWTRFLSPDTHADCPFRPNSNLLQLGSEPYILGSKPSSQDLGRETRMRVRIWCRASSVGGLNHLDEKSPSRTSGAANSRETGSPGNLVVAALKVVERSNHLNERPEECFFRIALRKLPVSNAGRCIQYPRQARSHGARHFYFTNHTLTGRRFLCLSNGTLVGLTADRSLASRCVLTGKMFRGTKWLLCRPIPTLIGTN